MDRELIKNISGPTSAPLPVNLEELKAVVEKMKPVNGPEVILVTAKQFALIKKELTVKDMSESPLGPNPCGPPIGAVPIEIFYDHAKMMDRFEELKKEGRRVWIIQESKNGESPSIQKS